MNSPNSPLFQRVRRYFHHGFGGLRLNSLGKNLVQFQGFGSGVRRRQYFAGDVIFDGADQGRLLPAKVQNGLDQKSYRGLAIGAGDPGHFQFLCRTQIKIRAEFCERTTAMWNYCPGNAGARMF